MPTDERELRVTVPIELLSAIDAIAMAQGTDRRALVIKLLTADVVAIAHEATLLTRMLRGNPLAMEAEKAS